MRDIGFSSGAVCYGDFIGALDLLKTENLTCLELSALRVSELSALVDALPMLDLSRYKYVSFHAPSSFGAQEEKWISDLLFEKVPTNWPIILHPDAIIDFQFWKRFGSRLAIENMDRRKPVGRTAIELQHIFDVLPEALLCFDIGHARQCDASMTEAFLILSHFSSKLVQIHISEVNSASQHDRISHGAALAFQQIAPMIPASVPVIIESRVSKNQIYVETQRAADALLA
jgi:hypothetical protein